MISKKSLLTAKWWCTMKNCLKSSSDVCLSAVLRIYQQHEHEQILYGCPCLCLSQTSTRSLWKQRGLEKLMHKQLRLWNSKITLVLIALANLFIYFLQTKMETITVSTKLRKNSSKLKKLKDAFALIVLHQVSQVADNYYKSSGTSWVQDWIAPCKL